MRRWVSLGLLLLVGCSEAYADRMRLRGRYRGGKTISGIVPWSSALSTDFDGATENVACGDDPAVDGASKLTIALFVKRDTSWDTTFEAIYGKFNWVGGNDTIQIAKAGVTGGLRVYIQTGNSVTTPVSSFSADTWECIGVVYDGTQATASDRVKIYNSGGEITGGTVVGTFPTTLPTNTDQWEIGSYNLGSSKFGPGNIDEVVTWIGVAASAAQIASYCAKTADPSALGIGAPSMFYKMGDNDDDTAIYDHGSVGLDCTTLTGITTADYVSDAP